LSGQQSSNQLTTLAGQFKRIVNLDTKMAVLTTSIQKTSAQIEKSATNQHKLLAELKELKIDTIQQFTDVN
jgi:hypothetical protein